jgi:hypothetical protein
MVLSETNMATSTFSFMYQWQTLIGAALGPFLAIILSLIGFWLRSIYLSWQDKKEAVRMVEVSITQTLNDLYSTRKKLEDFVRRLSVLVAEGRAINDNHTYFIATTNFPAARDVFFNADLPNLKFGSPYLHNQLMFANSGIKEINSWLWEMKENFSTLMENTKFMVTLEPKPQPAHQRASYADDLDAFANAVETFLTYIRVCVKGATQIKVYNLKLMNGRMRTIWKYERARFRYFKNAEELQKYRKWQNLLDRVNQAIEVEVNKSLTEAEEGYARL